MEQQSYLSGFDFNPVLASPGKRFLNYLIDNAFLFVLVFLSIYVYVIVQEEDVKITTNDMGFSARLIIYALYAVYFALIEIMFNGRTIGKFITGTKTVNRNGTEPEPKTLFLRSLGRIVPFEPFSALGNPSRPWHDKWTRTCVIDIKKTAMNGVHGS